MNNLSKHLPHIGLRKMKSILAVFVGLGLGLPLLLLNSYFDSIITAEWALITIELGVILFGILLVLCVAEVANCANFHTLMSKRRMRKGDYCSLLFLCINMCSSKFLTHIF